MDVVIRAFSQFLFPGNYPSLVAHPQTNILACGFSNNLVNWPEALLMDENRGENAVRSVPSTSEALSKLLIPYDEQRL